MNRSSTLGWGKTKENGVEMWDATPIFSSPPTALARLKLLFYPKRFFLYRALSRAIHWHEREGEARPFRILDNGCSTGATLTDLYFLFGKRVELFGVDVVRLEIDIAKQKLAALGVKAEPFWYDGITLPFEKKYFDAVFSSDVLGHVEKPETWLKEISRVLRPGGLLAMFAESKPGKHAVVRRYLLRHGVNVDPHAEFHISLFSKEVIRQMIEQIGVEISFFSAGPALNFLLYPDEAFATLQASTKVPIYRTLNRFLNFLKRVSAPFSVAVVEFLTTLHFATLGRILETQGCLVIGKKR